VELYFHFPVHLHGVYVDCFTFSYKSHFLQRSAKFVYDGSDTSRTFLCVTAVSGEGGGGVFAFCFIGYRKGVALLAPWGAAGGVA